MKIPIGLLNDVLQAVARQSADDYDGNPLVEVDTTSLKDALLEIADHIQEEPTREYVRGVLSKFQS